MTEPVAFGSMAGEDEVSDFHGGIYNDQLRAKTIPPEERCERCEGTGNEFYAMYHQCSDCGGTGRREAGGLHGG